MTLIPSLLLSFIVLESFSWDFIDFHKSAENWRISKWWLSRCHYTWKTDVRTPPYPYKPLVQKLCHLQSGTSKIDFGPFFSRMSLHSVSLNLFQMISYPKPKYNGLCEDSSLRSSQQHAKLIYRTSWYICKLNSANPNGL